MCSLLWRNVPGFVRDLFLRCFTAGLTDPKERVSDSEWCDAMMRLRDSTFPCPGCDLTRYDDGGPPVPCPHCGPDRSRAAIHIAHHRIVVSDQSRITAHHLRHDFDAETTVAAAEAHPTKPDVLGLRNDTEETWRFHMPDGRLSAVAPSKRVRMIPGMLVEMGSHQARVVAASDR